MKKEYLITTVIAIILAILLIAFDVMLGALMFIIVIGMSICLYVGLFISKLLCVMFLGKVPTQILIIGFWINLAATLILADQTTFIMYGITLSPLAIMVNSFVIIGIAGITVVTFTTLVLTMKYRSMDIAVSRVCTTDTFLTFVIAYLRSCRI